MRMLGIALALVLEASTPARAQDAVTFPTSDDGTIHATVYGGGVRGVVLAHGGRFDQHSWAPQARALAEAGFVVLAFDFRGYGQSRGPDSANPAGGRRAHDVLAAVRHLRGRGATSVAVVGASMGGDHAAEAAEEDPKAIDRLVLLAAGAYTPLVRMTGSKLFIMSRDDVIGDNRPRLPAIREQFERAIEPKRFVVLEGAAHAQALFDTPQADQLMREILAFLSAP